MDKYPTAFDWFTFPIAVYDREGKIVGANKMFRRLAGIKPEDIQLGAAHFFACLADENAVLLEAARNAFDGKERVYQGIGRALRSEPGTTEEYQLNHYPNVIFFPMAVDREGVSQAAVLLDEEKTDNDADVRVNQNSA